MEGMADQTRILEGVYEKYFYLGVQHNQRWLEH